MRSSVRVYAPPRERSTMPARVRISMLLGSEHPDDFEPSRLNASKHWDHVRATRLAANEHPDHFGATRSNVSGHRNVSGHWDDVGPTRSTKAARWDRWAVLGLFGAITLGLCACSRPRQPDDARTTGQSKDVIDYSLTQHGQNQPDRTACPGGRCGDDASQPLAPGPLVPGPSVRGPSVRGSCDVELCEGELTPAAIAELRASAEKANDCYERELKTQNQLEGKMLVRLRLAVGREPCDVRIEQSSVKGSDDFNNCVLDRLRRTAARPSSECVDVALPLSFVRKEVDASPDAGPAAAPTHMSR